MARTASRRRVDRQLLNYSATARKFLALAVLIGAAAAACVIAQAALVASIVAGAVVGHRSLGDLRAVFAALVAVVVGRAALAWAAEWAAHRASATAQSELRQAVVQRVATLGPDGPLGLDQLGPIDGTASGKGDAGRVSALVVTGLEALDGYFARYLPQVVLAVVVPLAVVAAVAGADWVSALIVAVTVPLIPIFMALVGAATGERTARRMASLQRLAGHFLDVVKGLPTLKVFGRAKAQAEAIAEVTERYRATTLATLQLTFLSSLVLELLATFSVALVAVAVGLRLLGGHLSFETALFVLVLVPEAYLPLRSLAANFHASADGLAAAGEALRLIEPSAEACDVRSGPRRRARCDRIEVDGLIVAHPGRDVPAPDGLDLVVSPGETVVLLGPSGCGKSTLLDVLLGLRVPTAGSVRIGGVPLEQLDFDEWRSRVAWMPQRPHFFARSVADNVRIGQPLASDVEVAAALSVAGLAPVMARLSHGSATPLGAGGAGLSVGERQRLAFARVVVRNAPVLLLDEPTAYLDVATEEAVVEVVRRLCQGRTAVVVAHHPALASVGDRVIDLRAPLGVR
jgi:ATP-binding cassette, subfamily C, bacterial CydCD